MLNLPSNPKVMLKQAANLYTEENLNWVDRTVEKVIAWRKWDASPDEVRPVIEQSGVRFIPKQIVSEGGGAYSFPVFDPLGYLSLAQLRFVHPVGESQTRYVLIGNQSEHLGPRWFGLDPGTLERLTLTRTVLIVEGPFDVLACRIILGADIPVLCPLGKKLYDDHVRDLQCLGVVKILAMFDSDEAGASAKLPSIPTRRGHKQDVERTILRCPGKDPSDCLKDLKTAKLLYREVHRAVTATAPLLGPGEPSTP